MAGTDFSHLTNDELIKGIQALDLPDYIRSKAYGIDVRETLAQMTEMTIQLGVNMGLSPDEALAWARKLQESVSQSEFDSWVATLLDGGPSIFMNTLSELQTTYPNGAAGVALVRETDPAKIYVWNGTAWEDFGDYQGIEVKDGSVTSTKIADKSVGVRHTNFITQAADGKNYLGSNIEIQPPSIKSLPNNIVGINQSTYITTGSNGKNYLGSNILIQKGSLTDVNAEIGIKEQPISEIHPLSLPNTFGFDEAVHPTVVYIPESFGGYKYWLVQTPIPYDSNMELYIDRYEIPHVHASNDGYNWEIVVSPLDDVSPQEIANGAYMSDPHIIYRPDINQLEVFYRLTKGGGLDGYNSSHETQLLRKTSTDGVNWTEREVILEMGPSYSDNLNLMISQAVIWDNTQKKYRFWYNNYSGNVLQRDWDGTTWGEIKTVGVSKNPVSAIKYQEKWHLDVAYYRGKYHMTTYDYQENEINYWVSNDGLYFAFVKNLLKSSRDAQPIYAGGLYRPVTILDESGNQRLYVSGRQANGGKSTVFCITQNQITNINLAMGKTRIENAVFENGMTATEIVNLITSIV